MKIKNVNIIAIAKVAKILYIINLGDKHGWTISNSYLKIAKNSKLINIKKY